MKTKRGLTVNKKKHPGETPVECGVIDTGAKGPGFKPQ